MYLEGLQADPDFSLTYQYLDINGSVQASVSVHISIADLSLVDANGDSLPFLQVDEDLTAMLAGDNETVTDGSLQSVEFKTSIKGLSSSEIKQVTVTSDAGDHYQDALTDSGAGAESNKFGVVVDNGGQALTTAQRGEIHSAYNVNAVAPKDGDSVEVKTKKGDDQSRKVGVQQWIQIKDPRTQITYVGRDNVKHPLMNYGLDLLAASVVVNGAAAPDRAAVTMELKRGEAYNQLSDEYKNLYPADRNKLVALAKQLKAEKKDDYWLQGQVGQLVPCAVYPTDDFLNSKNTKAGTWRAWQQFAAVFAQTNGGTPIDNLNPDVLKAETNRPAKWDVPISGANGVLAYTFNIPFSAASGTTNIWLWFSDMTSAPEKFRMYKGTPKMNLVKPTPVLFAQYKIEWTYDSTTTPAFQYTVTADMAGLPIIGNDAIKTRTGLDFYGMAKSQSRLTWDPAPFEEK